MYMDIYVYVYISSAAHYSATVLTEVCFRECVFLEAPGGTFNRHFWTLWDNFHTKSQKIVSLRRSFWCLWRHFVKKGVKRERCFKFLPKWRTPGWKTHSFEVIVGRIFRKSMLQMCPGIASATGVCFIGFWTAPTQKKWHTKPIKTDKSLESCSKSHFAWKIEKPGNWCTEVCVGQFWESFLRPGGHTNLKKTAFVDTVFFSWFLASKKEGGSRAGNGTNWRVVP